MPRGFSTTNANASQASALNIFLAISIAFPSGTKGYCTGPRDYVWGGITYTGDGTLGAVDAMEEGADATSRSVQFSMAGMNTTLAALLQANDYRLSPVTAYLGFADASWNTLDTPGITQLLKVSGVDRTISKTQGSNVIQDVWALTCESYLVDMSRQNGLRQVNSDQQTRFAGDLFFSLKPTLAYRLLYWGPNPYALPSAGGGGGARGMGSSPGFSVSADGFSTFGVSEGNPL